MVRRINIVLPESTIDTIDSMVHSGQRSRFIDEAVRHFVSYRAEEAVRRRLESTVVRDRDLDREVAADWFTVDQEAWQRLDSLKKESRTVRNAVKSTSSRSTRR